MVEAPPQEIENIQHDSRIPFSGPGGRRFKSSLPDQLFPMTYSTRSGSKNHPFWFCFRCYTVRNRINIGLVV